MRGCLVAVLLLFLVPATLCSALGGSNAAGITSVLAVVCVGLCVWALSGGEPDRKHSPPVSPDAFKPTQPQEKKNDDNAP